MSFKIAILQPSYLPWLGYFDQLANVDLFVYYDDVQYTRRDWRNRNRIKGPDGALWLTVPVAVKGRYHASIDAVRVADQYWRARHISTIRHCYAQSPYFASLFPKMIHWLEGDWDLLADGCIRGIELCKAELGLATPTLRSSTIAGLGDRGRTERLIAICQNLGATDYLTGSAARAYLDVDAFQRAGIDVFFQDYVHPLHKQAWGEFVSHLSILDLLMNEGPRSLEILSSSAAPRPAEALP